MENFQEYMDAYDEMINEKSLKDLSDVKGGMKNLSGAVKELEKGLKVSFGSLNWKLLGRVFSADITKSHVKGIWSALFKRMRLEVYYSTEKNSEFWNFTFDWLHPSGASNGKTIGTVTFKDGKKWSFKKDTL